MSATNGLELTLTHTFIPSYWESAATGDLQGQDGKHIVELDNGKHTGIVPKLCLTIVVFC